MVPTHDQEEELKIKNFDYNFNKFFLKPKGKTRFQNIEAKIYETANKVGVWVIGFFLAYHLLKLVNYCLQMFWRSYTPVEIIIPEYLISIVSAIIGFYFGQRFTSLKE